MGSAKRTARCFNAATRPGVVVLVCALALAGWCFRGVLFRGELFAFRDAGHYYPPLYRLVHEQWSAGQVPLWNPYENLGQPLAADPTAAVFYPGKLVFAVLPSWDWAWRVYVLGHLGLALLGAYVLARRLGAGAEAAGAGALSYAFSGSVLFQYCNVACLVGAAWLPLGLWAVDRMCWGLSPQRVPAPRSSATGPQRAATEPACWSWHSTLAPALLLAVALGMMVLGGDPQIAYHAVLLAVLYLVFLPGPSRAARSAAHNQTPLEGDTPGRLRLMVPLVGAVALAGLLAAVQILPAMELSALSARDPGAWADRLLARWEPDTHAEHIYHFSVGPWRLAELVWPNVGGRQLPVHRRWFEAVPAEGRIWTPSLYLGIVPLVLAWGALRWRRTRGAREEPADLRAAARRRWLSWMALLALAAGLGWYGLGWIVHEIRVACGADAKDWLVGAPFGGLYWLMTLVLPGYARFRYPAKLLVVAALGLSMLAALGWDRMVQQPHARTLRRLKRIAVISLLLAVAALLVRPFWAGWLAGVGPDPLFGPLDAAGAWQDLFGAFVQTALVCALCWRMMTWCARRPARLLAQTNSGNAPHAPGGAVAWISRLTLVVLAADLAVANGWLVVGAPAALWHEKPRLGRVIAQREATRRAADSTGWPGLERKRSPGEPTPADSTGWPGLERKRSPGEPTPADSTGWPGLERKRSPGEPTPQHAMPGETAGSDDRRAAPAANSDSEGRELLTVWRQPIFLPDDWRQSSSPDRVAQEVAWDRATLFPKHHLASRIRVLGVYGAFGLEPTRKLLVSPVVVPLASYVILPEDRSVPGAQRVETDVPDVSLWFNPHHLARAWIEHPSDRARDGPTQQTPDAAVPGAFASQALPGEWCGVVDHAAERVELKARLTEPGLVVLADQHYPGWRVRVESDGRAPYEAQIVPAGGLLRGVWLGPGEHRLVYVYRPASVLVGGVLSALGWLIAGGLVVIGLWRRDKQRVFRAPPTTVQSPQSGEVSGVSRGFCDTTIDAISDSARTGS